MAKKLDNASKSTENDFENQYDSTWDDEDDEEQRDRTKVSKQQTHRTRRDLYAAKDMQNYRHMCRVSKQQTHHTHRDLYAAKDTQNYRPMCQVSKQQTHHTHRDLYAAKDLQNYRPVCQVSKQQTHHTHRDLYAAKDLQNYRPVCQVSKQQTHHTHRDLYAAKDLQNYRPVCQVPATWHPPRLDPPGPQSIKNAERSEDDEREMFNLKFYQSMIPSHPDGLFIQDFHEYWVRDYKKLEYTHSYIQWLFPIQEQGVNHCAHVLTQKEIKFFRKDKELKRRLLTSYKIMLDFYGIKLLNENTGVVGHAENWKERFQNLNRNTHNNLRITRILKCLGILGFEHYQAPLVKFFLTETLVEERLPRVKRSVLDYFMFSVLNTSERKELIRFAFEKFEPKEEFVWCPKRIQRRFLKEIKIRKAGNHETHPSGSESGVPRQTSKARKQKEKRQDQIRVPLSQPLQTKNSISCCCIL
ncbi:hypothetical protein MHYP_G00267660 [Metynnis hypsauchen]